MSKSGSNKPKIQEQNSTLFAMGYVDLILKLKLTDKDLLKSEEEQKQAEKAEDRYFHIEDFKTIEDLIFLKDKKELWDRIILSGGNDTLKQLLLGSQISKNKCKIEYFGYNFPTFEDNTEFFSDIFKYVCSKHNLYISETPLEESARFTLNIILSNKQKKIKKPPQMMVVTKKKIIMKMKMNPVKMKMTMMSKMKMIMKKQMQ